MLYLSAKRHRFIFWWEDALWKTFWETFLKDQSFHLVHWLRITVSLRKTSRESINLERKFYLDCSSDTLCTQVEFGRVTYWLQTLRSWKRWTHLKATRKDWMQKRWYFSKKKENIFFQSQMDESNFLEEIRTSEHPQLGTGTSNSRRKSSWISWRIKRVSSTTSRLVSGCRWSDKRLSGPCQEASFSAITSNPRVKFYSPREESFPIPLKNIDVSRNYSYEFGCQARAMHRWFFWNIDGWRDLSDSWTGFTQFTLLEEKPPNGNMWSIQARLFMARTLDEIGKKCQAEGEAKVVLWKTETR